MEVMLVLLEGLVMSFWLLLVCVAGIANGPAELVVLYEQDVQDRVIELGYITKEKLKRNYTLTSIALFVPILLFVPAMVYGINGADGFWSGFWQMTIILIIMNLFDRIFIDWYWVGHTKAWFIPGTEDLMPYIPMKVVVKKWVGTMIGFPMLAAVIAGIMTLIVS